MPQQRYCAKRVFDAPAYSQGVKVNGPGTTLYISGQIAQDAKGRVGGRGNLLADPDYLLESEGVAFVEGR